MNNPQRKPFCAMSILGTRWWIQSHYHKHLILLCIGAEIGSTCSDDIKLRWTSVQWKIHFLFWGLTGSFPVSRSKPLNGLVNLFPNLTSALAKAEGRQE